MLLSGAMIERAAFVFVSRYEVNSAYADPDGFRCDDLSIRFNYYGQEHRLSTPVFGSGKPATLKAGKAYRIWTIFEPIEDAQ